MISFQAAKSPYAQAIRETRGEEKQREFEFECEDVFLLHIQKTA